MVSSIAASASFHNIKEFCSPPCQPSSSSSTRIEWELGGEHPPHPIQFIASEDPQQDPPIPTSMQYQTPEPPSGTPARRKRPARPRTCVTPLPEEGFIPPSAKIVQGDDRPKNPVATPTNTPCKKKIGHSNWGYGGSNGSVRQYTCKECSFRVREQRVGDGWVAIS